MNDETDTDGERDRLAEIHEGIDISLRHTSAIIGLIAIHPDLDDDVQEAADAASAHLRSAKGYADDLNEWRAANNKKGKPRGK